MVFFKIFQMLLYPSVFILVFFILGMVFAFYTKRKKLGSTLLFIGITIFYLCSITLVADLIILPLEKQYDSQLDIIESVDTIILLTGGLRSTNFPSTSKLSESSLFRTIEVAQIYFKAAKKPKIIISGNNPVSSEKKEAHFIRELLESFNVQKEDIVLEEESQNTYESAKNLKKIMGSESFLLVTSAYHMPRSIYIFKKFEMNPIPAPCDYRARFQKQYTLLGFFPQPNNFKKVNLAFHEYFGLIFYYFLK